MDVDKGCVLEVALRFRRNDSDRSADRNHRTHHRKVVMMTSTMNVWQFFIVNMFNDYPKKKVYGSMAAWIGKKKISKKWFHQISKISHEKELESKLKYLQKGDKRQRLLTLTFIIFSRRQQQLMTYGGHESTFIELMVRAPNWMAPPSSDSTTWMHPMKPWL